MTLPGSITNLRPTVRPIERVCIVCGVRFTPRPNSALIAGRTCSSNCAPKASRKVIPLPKRVPTPEGCRYCFAVLSDPVNIELGGCRPCRVERQVRRSLKEAGIVADHLKARRRAVAVQIFDSLPIID